MLITLDRGNSPSVTPSLTSFNKHELKTIVAVYSTLLAKGIWRDYAMDFEREMAVFSFFRHANEQPHAAIIKLPANTSSGWIFETWVERKRIERSPFLDKSLNSLYRLLAESLTN